MIVDANVFYETAEDLNVPKNRLGYIEYITGYMDDAKNDAGRVRIALTGFYYNRECHICLEPFHTYNTENHTFYTKSGQEFTFDHLSIKSEGGSDSIVNGRPCCKKCNHKRGPRAVFKTKHGHVRIQDHISYKAEHIISFFRKNQLVSASKAKKVLDLLIEEENQHPIDADIVKRLLDKLALTFPKIVPSEIYRRLLNETTKTKFGIITYDVSKNRPKISN